MQQVSHLLTDLRLNYNIALGHALSEGRTSVGIEDIPMAVKVSLSTAPQNRYKVFAELLRNRGSITNTQIQDSLHVHRSTAKKAMTELKAVGLVDGIKSNIGSEHDDVIVLKEEFHWFKGLEFDAVQKDDYRRYHEYLENLNKCQVIAGEEGEKEE